MTFRFLCRQMLLLIATFLLAAGITIIVSRPAMAAAPTYQMPFPCNGNEAWQGTTYDGHSNGNYALDLNQENDFGKTVVASAGGTVTDADGDYDISSNDIGGRNVVINHGGGHSTYYGHLNTVDAYLGQVVQQGTPIGTVGSTGHTYDANNRPIPVLPHLHYEQRFNGVAQPISFDGTAVTYSENGISMISKNCSGDSGTISDRTQTFTGRPGTGNVVENITPGAGGHYYVAAGGSLFWFNKDDPALRTEFINQMQQRYGTDQTLKMNAADIHAIEGSPWSNPRRRPDNNTFLIDKAGNAWYMMQYGHSWWLRSPQELAYLGGTGKQIVVPAGSTNGLASQPTEWPIQISDSTGNETLLKALDDPNYYEMQARDDVLGRQ